MIRILKNAEGMKDLIHSGKSFADIVRCFKKAENTYRDFQKMQRMVFHLEHYDDN